MNSNSAALLGSSLGQSISSPEVSKQNKLILAPTDTQATLAAQLSWVSLTQSVVHSQEKVAQSWAGHCVTLPV